MGNEKPLVSFCVKCYNQKHLIGYALRGAFAQTYSPLEIVISDDASTDGSQELIESLVEEYRKNGGLHRVVFIKNEKNLGNLGNWQKLCETAKGELLIQADGDDVSLPERTEQVVAAWIGSGRKATVITNQAVCFTGGGQIVGMVKSSEGQGAVTTYARWALDKFPPLDMSLAGEAGDDAIYSRRAKLFGPCVCVPQVLTCYRVGSGATTNHGLQIGAYRRRMVRWGFKSELAAIRQALHDLDGVRNEIGELAVTREAQWRKDAAYYQDCLVLWDSGGFFDRLRMFTKLYLFKERMLLQLVGIVLCLPRCLGDLIFDVMFGGIGKIKAMKYLTCPKISFADMENLGVIINHFVKR